MQLQEELTTTENQISFSRQHYNATVLDFNNTIQTIPSVLIAGPLGFTKREFFDAEPEAAEVPKRRPDARLIGRRRGSGRTRVRLTARMASSTFYSQIGANKRNSVLLALLVVAPARRARPVHRLGGHRRPARGDPVARASRSASASGARCSRTTRGDSLVLATSRARRRSRPRSCPSSTTSSRRWRSRPTCRCRKVYLIDDTAPNAFATGRDPKHASVAITTGLLQKLDREELQGVMAHELSHVRNFDIRFSLHGRRPRGVDRPARRLLPAVHVLGRGTAEPARLDSGGGGGLQIVIFVVAIALAILAPIVARLVQLAVSRQREYLADASGVELTRNPVGLERALAKITLDTEPLEVANRATQHLYFDNPIKAATGRSSSLFSTHPAALDRINRLRELTASRRSRGTRWTRARCAHRWPQPASRRSARRGTDRRPPERELVPRRSPASRRLSARSGSALFSAAPTGPAGTRTGPR